MNRVSIRSRLGNVVLAIAGTIYALAAVGLFVFYLVTTWVTAHLLDRMLQMMLVAAAVAGVYFIVIAAPRLGMRIAGHLRDTHAPVADEH